MQLFGYEIYAGVWNEEGRLFKPGLWVFDIDRTVERSFLVWFGPWHLAISKI